MIVNLQGDLPIFKSELIKKTANLFLDEKTEIGSAVCELEKLEIDDRNIVKAKVLVDKRDEGLLEIFVEKSKIKKLLSSYWYLYLYPTFSKKVRRIESVT